jgi:hypothetical protein
MPCGVSRCFERSERCLAGSNDSPYFTFLRQDTCRIFGRRPRQTFEMSDDYSFFEYHAKITNAGHAENEGESVHCMIRMKSVDACGKRRRNVELEQQAGDNILFVINPGPHRKISHSSIWSVSEEIFGKAGSASDYHQVGDCEIFFYKA